MLLIPVPKRGGRRVPARVAVATVSLLLLAPVAAEARVHTFSPLSHGVGGSAAYKLAGVDARAIVDARLGDRRVNVRRVRRAARSHDRLLRLRVAKRRGGRTTRALFAVTTAPQTTITNGPAEGAQTTTTTAAFSFKSSSSRSTFRCSLDGAEAAPCSSGKSYGGLAVGAHRFSVYAVDRHGTADATPAVRSWTVSAPAPTPTTPTTTPTPTLTPTPTPTPTPAPAPAAPAAPEYTVPASVPSGCSTDATSALLAWIATVPNGATLKLGAGACYRIEGTLELRNRRLAVNGNGATLRSYNAPTANRAIWRLWDSDVALRDLTIVGSYANGGVHDANLQHAHAIDLRGTSATIERVAMSDLAGDCVYFGLGAVRSSGALRDSSCRRIGRNGVSVTAADDLRVERVTTDRIGYIVFDVEPNTGTGFGAQRVVFDGNTIGTYYMKAYTILGNAPISAQSFTNNRIVGETLRIGIADRAYRPSGVTIAGNTTDTPSPNNAMSLYGITGLTVTDNTVPLAIGTMAYVSGGCDVKISGNRYPGGYREAYMTAPGC